MAEPELPARWQDGSPIGQRDCPPASPASAAGALRQAQYCDEMGPIPTGGPDPVRWGGHHRQGGPITGTGSSWARDAERPLQRWHR